MEPYDPTQDPLFQGPDITDEDLERMAAENQALELENERVQKLGKPEPEEEVTTESPQAQPQQPQQPPEEKSEEDNKIDKIAESWRQYPRETAETALAVPTGVLDFGTDLLNWAIDASDTPVPHIPKIPKFQNEIAEAARNIASFVGPTMGVHSLGMRGLSWVSKGSKISKLANDPFIKWLGKTFVVPSSSGAAVESINVRTLEDHNLTGQLKQMWPRTYGWIPDSFATLNSDTPDMKRQKTIVEGFTLGAFGTLAEAALAGARAKFLAKALKKRGAIPEQQTGKIVGDTAESEAALNQIRPKASLEDARDYYIETVFENNREALDAADVTEEVLSKKWADMSDELKEQWRIKAQAESPALIAEAGAAARSDAIDELGAFNFSQSQNLDEPLFGVHDLYGYREYNISTPDPMGIVGASVDLSRILRNYDTVDGSMGSVMSEAAIKFANADATGKVQETILRGLTQQILDAGQYSYISSTGKKITYGEIVNDGLALAGEFYGESVEDLITRFRPFLQNTDQYGVRQLDDQGYKLAMKSIRDELNKFADPTYMRSQGYIAGSMSRQVSDLSEGLRLMSGTEAVERGSEMILDRIHYLMMLTGQTRRSRGLALEKLRLVEDIASNPRAGKRFASLAEQQEMLNAGFTQEMAQLKTNVNQTINTLRFLNQQDPAFIDEFALAYEMSGGQVDSVKKLNDIVAEAVKGPISKGIYDANPEMESLIMKNMWTGLYNSMLSSASTTIKAGVSTSINLVERPLTHFGGALMAQDAKMFRSAWAEYSAFTDTLQKGLTYAKSIWRKSAIDPSAVTPRDYIQPQESMAFQLVKQRADRMARDGDYAGQVFVSKIEEWQDFNASPWARLGQRGMGTIDGFSQAIIGNWEARSRAYQELSNFGEFPVQGAKLKELSDKIYNSIWTKDGKLQDRAVEFAAGEVNFNLDTTTTQNLNQLIKRLPILKPFLLFQKTQINSVKYTGSHTPLGEFIGVWKKFNSKFEDIGFERAQQLLSERGIFSDSIEVVEAEYKKQRAILRGRSAFGTMITGSAVSLFMNDRVTGNGTANYQLNRARTEYNKPKRSFKGLDGQWHSYDGFGAISDWLAITVDIMDNGLDGNWHGKAALRPFEIEENLRAMAFVISASLTDKSFTAALEPFTDMVSGDISAMNRWSASFMTAATVPNSSLMAEFSRLMYPSLRVVDNDLKALIFNRTPFKGTLPEQHDYIDGGAIRGIEADDFWARIARTYLPFKTNGKMSDVKEFLYQINYSGSPVISTRKYSDAERSEITRIMGEDGLFRDGVRRIMQSRSAENFRQNYFAAQNTPNAPMPDLKSYENLHSMVDDELKRALRMAETKLSTRDAVQQNTYRNLVIKEMRRKPDNEEKVQNFANQ